MVATAVSTRLRRSKRTHDEYVVCVGGRQVVATVTAHVGAARQWEYATRWRHGGRLRSEDGLTVGSYVPSMQESVSPFSAHNSLVR
ncbi:hypothetical protein E2562_032494 [Oryza meyeriana var. granulata]|uniref:Uncharacterized protein n=1 Tax=Oryza meyeriana var. granulata TaxID=110450 RepID=A0A6G1E5G1_9ORYZ|nr:hypothetical protein E2562_032494 [Oryza meyeriana var. granulata]